jgi:sulfoxide reductase heme-binding subunit YedZ
MRAALMTFNWQTYLLWLILGLPALLMLNRFAADSSTAASLLHGSGEFSARMTIIAMLATPLRLLFAQQRWTYWLVKHRRHFGVAAFGYALLHTVFYLVDRMSLAQVIEEFGALGIWTGWAAFLIFIPLAITSNDYSQRLLRTRWKLLQRGVYAAAVLTLVHWIFVHNEPGPALVHFIPLALFECFRVYKQQERVSQSKAA